MTAPAPVSWRDLEDHLSAKSVPLGRSWLRIKSHFGTADRLLQTDLRQLMAVRGVGVSTARRIRKGLQGFRQSEESAPSPDPALESGPDASPPAPFTGTAPAFDGQAVDAPNDLWDTIEGRLTGWSDASTLAHLRRVIPRLEDLWASDIDELAARLDITPDAVSQLRIRLGGLLRTGEGELIAQGAARSDERIADVFAEAAAIAFVLDGATTVGEVFSTSVRADISDAGSSLSGSIQRLDPWGTGTATGRWWSKLDDRHRTIVTLRTCAHEPATLAEIGRALGLTRERVRQVETSLVADKLLQEVRDRLLVAATAITKALGSRPDRHQFDALVARFATCLPIPKEVASQLIVTALPYADDGAMIVHEEIRDQIENIRTAAELAADANGVIDVEQAALALDADDPNAVLELAAIERVRSHWVLADTQRVRVRLALEDLAEPATKLQIAELAGLADRVRTVSNILSSEPDIVRITKDTWGYAVWTDDPYDGIAEEIVQRIEANGGTASFHDLVDELPARFDVSASSVRSYLNTPRFALEGDVVRLAEDMQVSLRPLAEVPDVHVRRGRATYEFVVEERYLSGYSVIVPAEVADALGCGPGDSLDVPVARPADCEPVSLIWTAHAVTGPALGRVRVPLERLAASGGDMVVMTLNPAGVVFELTTSTDDPAARDNVLPLALPVAVGRAELQLDRLESNKGNAWYAFRSDNTGGYLPAGVAISPPTDALPRDIVIADKPFELEPVPRWDEATNSYVDGEFEDFETTRRVEGQLLLADVVFRVQAKVTVRRDGKWNVTVRVSPTEPTDHLALETGDGILGAEDVKIESLLGEPALPHPLYRHEGNWFWRWAVTNRPTAPMLPPELLELNELDPTTEHRLRIPDGRTVRLTPSGGGTAVEIDGIESILDLFSPNSGDHLFLAPTRSEELLVRRLSKQKLGFARSPLKKAALLCGLDDEHLGMSDVAWTFGLDDVSVRLSDLAEIAKRRSDRRVERELRKHLDSAGGTLPELDHVFDGLDDF